MLYCTAASAAHGDEDVAGADAALTILLLRDSKSRSWSKQRVSLTLTEGSICIIKYVHRVKRFTITALNIPESRRKRLCYDENRVDRRGRPWASFSILVRSLIE